MRGRKKKTHCSIKGVACRDSLFREGRIRETFEAWNTNLSQWDTPALTDADGKENGQFDDSPVDLSGLDAGVYTKLRLSATLTTTDVANPEGPAVDRWKITYQP